ncbi:MAG TPA: C39 family peptidase [Anaerolineales bacterium]|nr:C39 family peptidase [Anaerolineales bacterium]
MPEPVLEMIRLPYHVPYYAQVASPELAEAIFVHGMDPAQDPRWAESGAESPQEYAYWVERACGVACLKMCVEAGGGPVRSLVDWARLGQERGGYLVRQDAHGAMREVGWVHNVLAEMARESGLAAESHPASLEEIPVYLRQGRMVIASVSYEAGDDRLPITMQGGHLMVVVGAECLDGRPCAFYVNNPSGRRAELQAGARLSQERFAAAYSGRVIVIGRA